MGRAKLYDEDQTLQAAMRVFRARGYAGTSLKDLEDSTQLKAGSLYHFFGSKEGLFLAAIDHYNQSVVQQRIDTYLKGDAPQEELRALFLSILKEPGGTSYGCLLTNTAVEFRTASPEVFELVNDGFKLLEDAFARQCALAMSKGTLAHRPTTKWLALRLLHAYQGFLVLVRFGRSNKEMTHVINEFFDDFFNLASGSKQ